MPKAKKNSPATTNVGGAHASVNTEAVGVTLSPSETKLALQPGLGINLMTTDKVGIRVAADYRRVFLGEDRGGENEFRFTIGILLAFGKQSPRSSN